MLFHHSLDSEWHMMMAHPIVTIALVLVCFILGVYYGRTLLP